MTDKRLASSLLPGEQAIILQTSGKEKVPLPSGTPPRGYKWLHHAYAPTDGQVILNHILFIRNGRGRVVNWLPKGNEKVKCEKLTRAAKIPKRYWGILPNDGWLVTQISFNI